MKKYIFKIEDVKTGQLFPFKILNADEEFSVEDPQEYIIFEADSYNENLVYYDVESNSIQKKSKTRLFQEGIYRLKIGEIFEEETQEFKMIEQPSEYHNWNGKEWEVDIKEVKDIVNEKWKVERQIKIDQDTNYKGFIFQTREYTDIHNFEQYGFLMMLGKAKQSDKVEWRMKDNSYHEFTVQELLEVVAIWGARKKAIFEDNKRMWLELEKASTVEEIEKITWEVEE